MSSSRLPIQNTRKFLSFDEVCLFSAEPFLDPDVGEPFDIVPDAPGVIALIGGHGRALTIEACKRSMRKRVQEHYSGVEGGLFTGAEAFAFEATSDPATRAQRLIVEHTVYFGELPARRSA